MSKNPHKSIVVYGPQGSGKTALAKKLVKHFQLDRVVELDMHPKHRPLPKTGALILSNTEPPEYVRRKMHISEANRILTCWAAGYPF